MCDLYMVGVGRAHALSCSCILSGCWGRLGCVTCQQLRTLVEAPTAEAKSSYVTRMCQLQLQLVTNGIEQKRLGKQQLLQAGVISMITLTHYFVPAGWRLSCPFYGHVPVILPKAFAAACPSLIYFSLGTRSLAAGREAKRGLLL